jgi:hypothetical protein
MSQLEESSRRFGKVYKWVCVAGLLAVTGAPNALARPHYQSLDRLRFDYQAVSSGPGSTVGFLLPDGDILEVSAMLMQENPPQTGSALPQPGTPIFADFDVRVSFDSHRRNSLTTRRESMDASSMRMAIFADPTNAGPEGHRGFTIEIVIGEWGGGTLPPGMMLRESPTRGSGGRLSMDAVPGGFIVDSFFDIWTELSLDGGQSWIEADGALRMVSIPAPSVVTPIAATLIFAGRRRRR